MRQEDVVDVVAAEVFLGCASMMDPGVVHNKADFSVPGGWAVVSKRLKEAHKVGGFERPLFDFIVDDAINGDAHEERDVDSSVCWDGLDGSCSSSCPAPERGDVEVEPALVKEPEHLVVDLVHLLPVVEALVGHIRVEDGERPRGDLLVP